MVPTFPCFCEDGFEGCEFFVGHVKGAKEVLFEKRSAGKGEEEGGGKCLATEGWAWCALGRWRKLGVMHRLLLLLLHFVGKNGLVLAVRAKSVMDVVYVWDNLVAHVEAEFA